MEQLRATQSRNYLDDLIKLETLKSKGVITQEEFDQKKKDILATAGKAAVVSGPASSMSVLAAKLRELNDLYQKNTIDINECLNAKAKLIQQPLTVTDMKQDLETVQTLYNENIIDINERNTLKAKVLDRAIPGQTGS